MILLAWNCRGLAQAESKRSLKAIVNKVCSDLLFLSEVKISSNRVKGAGDLEKLETEENRKAKRKQKENTLGAAVTAEQHRREP